MSLEHDRPIEEVIAELRPHATDGSYAAHVLDGALESIRKYGLASESDMEAIAEMQRMLSPPPCEYLARSSKGCRAGLRSPCRYQDNPRKCEAYSPEEGVTDDELREDRRGW